ncbi:MAG: hypothetical protein ACTS22_00470 [Phycisphaerales bacterium]
MNRRTGLCALAVAAVLHAASGSAQPDGATSDPIADRLAAIPDDPSFGAASERYLAIFEIDEDAIIAKHVRDEEAARLGLQAWDRVAAMFPVWARRRIVQFNVQDGSRWAGRFDGSGANDIGRPGYKLSVAAYLLAAEENLADPVRPVDARRGTLDWTLVHEIGHYYCLVTDAVERFSQRFDARPGMPARRQSPDDYPEDGSPVIDGHFVTSYAERTPGDEETVETFTTYLVVPALPENDSLVAEKVLFFDGVRGMAELRRRIQALGRGNAEPG